ncbi:MAG: hypothetical protein ACE5NA_05510 [Nitrospiraceae bacterium]
MLRPLAIAWLPLLAMIPLVLPSSVVGETSDFEVTNGIYHHLPFLRPGLKFWDVYPGRNPGHGEPHALYTELPDGHRVRITRSSDLAPLIGSIRTTAEALQYVRFLSDPPAALDHPIEPFDDVPFYELRTGMGSAQVGPMITVSESVLARHQVSPPTVREITFPTGESGFLITRFVLLHEQIARLWEQYTRRPGEGLFVTEIGKVEERVYASGGYRLRLERIPVKGFEVELEPAELD